MNVRAALLVVMIIACFSMATMIACEDPDDLKGHDLSPNDQSNYAKDKTQEESCLADNLYISDCADACTCCFWGEVDLLGDCVFDCDEMLISYQDYPPAHSDFQQFKECVVGCWSLCDKPNKNQTCWEECNIYLEGAG